MTTVIDVNDYINSKEIKPSIPGCNNEFDVLYKYEFTINDRLGFIPRGYDFIKSSEELIIGDYIIHPNTWIPMVALCYNIIKGKRGQSIEGLRFENTDSYYKFGELLGSRFKFGNFIAFDGIIQNLI